MPVRGQCGERDGTTHRGGRDQPGPGSLDTFMWWVLRAGREFTKQVGGTSPPQKQDQNARSLKGQSKLHTWMGTLQGVGDGRVGAAPGERRGGRGAGSSGEGRRWAESCPVCPLGADFLEPAGQSRAHRCCQLWTPGAASPRQRRFSPRPLHHFQPARRHKVKLGGPLPQALRVSASSGPAGEGATVSARVPESKKKQSPPCPRLSEPHFCSTGHKSRGNFCLALGRSAGGTALPSAGRWEAGVHLQSRRSGTPGGSVCGSVRGVNQPQSQREAEPGHLPTSIEGWVRCHPQRGPLWKVSEMD